MNKNSNPLLIFLPYLGLSSEASEGSVLFSPPVQIYWSFPYTILKKIKISLETSFEILSFCHFPRYFNQKLQALVISRSSMELFKIIFWDLCEISVLVGLLEHINIVVFYGQLLFFKPRIQYYKKSKFSKISLFPNQGVYCTIVKSTVR